MPSAFVGGLQMPIKSPSCSFRFLKDSEQHREVDKEQNNISFSSSWAELVTL